MLKNKNLIISSLFMGFLLSLQFLNNPLDFLWAVISITILSYLFLLLFLYVLMFFAKKHGLSIELQNYIAQKKIKIYTSKMKDSIEKVRVFPLGVLFTLLVGLITTGLAFPLITLNIKFKKEDHTSFFIKTKEVYTVGFKLTIYTLLVLIFILSIFKGILPRVFFNILYRELFILLVTYLFPWSLVTEYFAVTILKMDIPQSFTSDNILLIDKKLYLSYSVFILSMFILSYFLNPLISAVLSGILSVYVWFLIFKREVLK